MATLNSLKLNKSTFQIFILWHAISNLYMYGFSSAFFEIWTDSLGERGQMSWSCKTLPFFCSRSQRRGLKLIMSLTVVHAQRPPIPRCLHSTVYSSSNGTGSQAGHWWWCHGSLGIQSRVSIKLTSTPSCPLPAGHHKKKGHQMETCNKNLSPASSRPRAVASQDMQTKLTILSLGRTVLRTKQGLHESQWQPEHHVWALESALPRSSVSRNK